MSFPQLNRPTFAHIDLEALAFNLKSVRDFIRDGIKVMAVVKANAYGHGAVECSKRLEAEGINWLGVALVEEALELRKAGVRTPILCLGSFWPEQQDALFENDLTPAVFDLDSAELLDRFAARNGNAKNVHVNIDTGMGRLGVPYQSLAEWVDRFAEFKNLHVEGLMTHFAAADDLNNDHTSVQMRRFAEAVSIFHAKGFRPTILDMANSPGAVAYQDSRATMVRIGGLLYGLGDDVLPTGIERPNLKPVMSLHSRIAYLKNVPTGESIGYGRTFTTARESAIATVPIGYHDGLRRCLSNKGTMLVNGRSAPIVGRISMDWTTLDVTDISDVKIGDEVVITGSQGNLQIKTEQIAAKCDTISYEITCGISSRVPRLYI